MPGPEPTECLAEYLGEEWLMGRSLLQWTAIAHPTHAATGQRHSDIFAKENFTRNVLQTTFTHSHFLIDCQYQ
ncbi:MAG: hypothetical protein AAFX40_01395 [Cyanobacteria bacterium J06639_1]